MKQINAAIVIFLSAVFLFAAVDKAFHYKNFVQALQGYMIIPRGLAPLLAIPIITLEALIGSGLLLRMWRRPAALSAAVTLVIFSIVLSINYLYGGPAACGCWFTITLAKSSQMHIAQNLAMAVLATCLWWGERTSSEGQSPAQFSAALGSTRPQPGGNNE